MTDRPMLFTGPMVRAILDGRKTQTRRVLKLAGRSPDYIGPRGCTDDPSCWGWWDDDRGEYWLVKRGESDRGWIDWSDWAGAYQVGDLLWVRETWQGLSHGDYLPTKSKVCDLRYAATDPLADADKDVRGYPWRPCIHMPRWASRLTLQVTEVRVQRLQDITLGDICREGLARSVYDFRPVQRGFDAWAHLWDSLNAERGYSWETNPWVCAVTFIAHQRNIDSEV